MMETVCIGQPWTNTNKVVLYTRWLP